MDENLYTFYKFLFEASENFTLTSFLYFFLWPFFFYFYVNDIINSLYDWLSARYRFNSDYNLYWLIYDVIVFPALFFSVIPLLNIFFSITMGILFLALYIADEFWFTPTYYTITYPLKPLKIF